jgi:hypothetical protein
MKFARPSSAEVRVLMGCLFLTSTVASCAFFTQNGVTAPTLSLAAATYVGSQNLTCCTPTPDAIITYTRGTDPDDPDRSSPVFPAQGLSLESSDTVKVMAYVPAWGEFTDSVVASAAYKIIDLWILGGTGSAWCVWRNGELGAPLSYCTGGRGRMYDGRVYLWQDSKVWADGVEVDLYSPQKTVAKDLAINGTTVYVVGEYTWAQTNPTKLRSAPCFWTFDLTAPPSSAVLPTLLGTPYGVNGDEAHTEACCVFGSKLYVAGWYRVGWRTQPCFWADTDEPQTVGDSEYYSSRATGVATDGSNVFTSGTSRFDQDNLAMYWYNGLQYGLDLGDDDPAMSRPIFDGTSYFVAGSNCRSNAAFWKITPGEPSVSACTILATDHHDRATAISVDGLDVFVCGSTAEGCCYWVNDSDHSVPLPCFAGVSAIYAKVRCPD